jgi:DNA repair exonuclease SbcCD nuclease subunit
MRESKYRFFFDLLRKGGFDSLTDNQLKILIVIIIPRNFIESLDLIATKTLLTYMNEKDLKSIIEKIEVDYKKKFLINSSNKDILLKMVLSQNQLININNQIRLLTLEDQQSILSEVPGIQLRVLINNLTKLRKNELLENVFNKSLVQLIPLLDTIETFRYSKIGIF